MKILSSVLQKREKKMIRTSVYLILLTFFLITILTDPINCVDTKNRSQRNTATNDLGIDREKCQRYGHSCLGGHGKRFFSGRSSLKSIFPASVDYVHPHEDKSWAMLTDQDYSSSYPGLFVRPKSLLYHSSSLLDEKSPYRSPQSSTSGVLISASESEASSRGSESSRLTRMLYHSYK